MTLRRCAELRFPQKSEFDVTGGDRVINITKALNGRTVLEVTSDSQTDHVKFGVVDPADVNTAASRSSLGSRLELTDRNRKTIGSLIIGHAVKNKPDNHYVRVTGKPTVYTIEFNDDILSAQAFGIDHRRQQIPNRRRRQKRRRLRR